MTVAPRVFNPKGVVNRIGHEYVERSHSTGGRSAIQTGYSALAETTQTLFSQIPVPVVFQEADPYDDYQDMAETVGREQQLRVYNQHTDHPILTHEETLQFRAVHDWFGHLEADVDFTPRGEFKKWEHMHNEYGLGLHETRALFAEVIGQVGVAHYLPNGFADDRFEQRAFLAPYRWIDAMQTAVND
jgi:hypothetical protein